MAQFKVSDYLLAIAEYLAANSEMVWNPDPDQYDSTDIGIVLKAVPLRPDRLVSISPYLLASDPVLPLQEIDFQVRTRGSQIPTDCDDIADTSYKLLHGKHHLVWNGLEISRVRYLSFASLGPDDQGRWERTDNYELITQRQES